MPIASWTRPRLTSLVRPLSGTSRHLVNGMAELRAGNTVGRVLFNYYGDRIADVGEVSIDSLIFRPATFIEMSLHNLGISMLIGAVLVVIVIIAFLYEWRSALVTIVAMPLSLLAAVWLLTWRGGTLDTMALAGLIIALGVVVDDAIIDVENIARRLRLNAASPEPKPAEAVVVDASLEVRSSVVYGSLIVMLVFIPVFFLPGLSGSFFRPLALAYVLAVLASLAVALTVTPALAMLLMTGATRTDDPPVVVRSRRRYARMLTPFLGRSRRAVGIVAATVVAGALLVPLLGEEFLPNFREYDFLMHWVEKPGTSLPAMKRITVRAAEELLAIPGVNHHGAHIGRAEAADEVVGVNFTELWISMDRDVDYDATVAKAQAIVDGYPGLQRDLLTYLRERVKEVLSGARDTGPRRARGECAGPLRPRSLARGDLRRTAHALDGGGRVQDRRVGVRGDRGARHHRFRTRHLQAIPANC